MSHAGSVLLRETATLTGLVAAVDDVLLGTYFGVPFHAPGQVFTDLAVAVGVADGANGVSGIGVLGDRKKLFVKVPSMPTAWRVLHRIDANHLDAVALRLPRPASGRAPQLPYLVSAICPPLWSRMPYLGSVLGIRRSRFPLGRDCCGHQAAGSPSASLGCGEAREPCRSGLSLRAVRTQHKSPLLGTTDVCMCRRYCVLGVAGINRAPDMSGGADWAGVTVVKAPTKPRAPASTITITITITESFVPARREPIPITLWNTVPGSSNAPVGSGPFAPRSQ